MKLYILYDIGCYYHLLLKIDVFVYYTCRHFGVVGVSKVLRATFIILVTLVMMTICLKKLDRNLVHLISLLFQLELTVQGWHLFSSWILNLFLKVIMLRVLVLIINVLQVG